jgi:DNA-binding NtrC family response regulator
MAGELRHAICIEQVGEEGAAMNDEKPRILLVGSPASFEYLMDLVEEVDLYTLDCASTIKTARFFLRRSPTVVILHLPEGPLERARRIEWMEHIKGQAPVIIYSDQCDVKVYLNAMERGAFDCLTLLSSREEILRALANAVRWRNRTAA